MEVQIDIGFDQLVQLAKQLPSSQWSKLKKEVDGGPGINDQFCDLEDFY